MEFTLKSRNGKNIGVLSLRGVEGFGDRYCYFIMSSEVIEAAKRNYPIIEEQLSRCRKGEYKDRLKILQSEAYFPIALRGLQELGAFRYYWSRGDKADEKILCLIHPEVEGKICISDSFWSFGFDGFEVWVVPAST